MHAAWSVECAAEDPVLVVPWNDPADPASATQFVDLRADPYDLHRIPEAEAHQPMMQALRALNAPRSPVFTAKCDAWPMSAEEVEQLHLDLDEVADDPAARMAFGFASYIDLVWRDRAVFISFHQQEQMLQRLVRHAAAIDRPIAALECVLRPALIDLDGPQEGYAVSLYVKALGADGESAHGEWGAALDALAVLIRSKELASVTGSRTRSARERSITID
jgi:hypothetical protein